MGWCCKPNKKCKFKKTNKCKKPPISTKKHHKSFTCLPGEKHCIVNENFHDNHYKKCNHYHIIDCNHITDHLHEFNIYHYDTKTTHEKKHSCEDIYANEPKDHCVEKKKDCPENKYSDYCYEYSCDHFKKHRENDDCSESEIYDYFYKYDSDYCEDHREDSDY